MTPIRYRNRDCTEPCACGCSRRIPVSRCGNTMYFESPAVEYAAEYENLLFATEECAAEYEHENGVTLERE